MSRLPGSPQQIWGEGSNLLSPVPIQQYGQTSRGQALPEFNENARSQENSIDWEITRRSEDLPDMHVNAPDPDKKATNAEIPAFTLYFVLASTVHKR